MAFRLQLDRWGERACGGRGSVLFIKGQLALPLHLAYPIAHTMVTQIAPAGTTRWGGRGFTRRACPNSALW